MLRLQGDLKTRASTSATSLADSAAAAAFTWQEGTPLIRPQNDQPIKRILGKCIGDRRLLCCWTHFWIVGFLLRIKQSTSFNILHRKPAWQLWRTFYLVIPERMQWLACRITARPALARVSHPMPMPMPGHCRSVPSSKARRCPCKASLSLPEDVPVRPPCVN